MIRKPTLASDIESPAVTADRAARLYQMLRLVATAPQTRGTLMRRLRLNLRGFYRDLGVLRAAGIPLEASRHRYTLQDDLNAALTRLPLPDPHLTLGEAMKLARGRLRAHRKLKGLIEQVVR